MPDLDFHVEGAATQLYSASPLLVFKLRLVNTDENETIHTVALRCQIQIETTRRHYQPAEQTSLRDLFGEPERWSQTLRPMLWTHASVIAPSFVGNTNVDLPVPCTFDFNVAAVKYFAGLENGEIPLCLQFSGTIFYLTDEGLLQIAQIPWNKEVKYRLPVEVWREMMDVYYPNSAWLNLRRDVFDRLYQYKVRQGLPTWEQTLESLLPRFDSEPGEPEVENSESEELIH